MVDLALWLNPLNGENPSGEDLRNDPRFHELERLAVPQSDVVHDERNRPSAEVSIPVDWDVVLEKADELRNQGRDLRLLTLVTRALANARGLAGLAEGLMLIARTFDAHWETMHPALRPNAPPRDAALRRVNAVLDLQNGQEGLLADLRKTVFFAPRGFGPISGRELEQGALDDRVMLQEAAQGLNNTERAALSAVHEQLLTRLRSACAAQADQANAAMEQLVADARAAGAALAALDAALNRRLESTGPAVPDLKKFLDRMLTTLERGSAARPAANGAAKPELTQATPAAAQPNGHAPEPVANHAGPTMALPERLTSRDDVVKCLDLVVAFYDRTEPSSPIPHLARRVRRMVHMDFVELMEDLAPSGLKEFRLLAGVTDKKTPQKDER
ncbi:type VI secretion system protein TssA [Aminobacter aganoensis]|uniref:Type VI secretion system protein ImpA n=1 Tax=Aminobacter aganoensis TaxID=83264 RepID=A0A7X0KI05_9HYPH|nr:type VI secretion system protein ImpA [Aminobacter aganoensis]